MKPTKSVAPESNRKTTELTDIPNPLHRGSRCKLLLLSGGSLVAQNIVAALSSRRDFCDLIAINSKADEPSVFDYDATYLAPSLIDNKEEFDAFFENIIDKIKPDLVIPCRDEDVAFLAEVASKRPEICHRLLCGDLGVARAMLDKAWSWSFSKQYDLPFAPTIQTNANIKEILTFVAKHGLPILAKPRKGFASQGVRLIYKHEQLASLIGRDGYILQRYLGDPARLEEYTNQSSKQGIPLFHTFEETKISIQGCIGPEGDVSGVCVTENVMQQGKSAFVSKSHDAIVYERGSGWVAKFAEAGWCGPINIQCQRDQDGRLAIYEYNGRFTGATSARVLLGFDEVGITIGLWLGQEFPQSEIMAGNQIVVRAPMSRVVDLINVQSLQHHRHWRLNKPLSS